MLLRLLNRDRGGATLVEVLLVLLIFALLVAIGVPNFMAMRRRVDKDKCSNNIRQIKLAKEQWALEHDKGSSATPVAADLDPYIKDGTASLICPFDPSKSFDTSYNINDIGTNPTCKICSPEDGGTYDYTY